jgi:pseudouridylate synthase
MRHTSPLLLVAPEVQATLERGGPVVALESTIISHGMPWPQNLETALRVEAAVREAGAVPATVALVEGRMVAGLSTAQIEALARAGTAVPKVSRRDLGAVLAAGTLGATTVAATMIVAARAGIRVFATGGIGGVHRGAAQSMDVSADLLELARTPVAVVCAGAKALLDLPLTMEVLETHGVPVIGHGTDRLPAFWSRDAGPDGPRVTCRLDTPEAIAAALRAHWGAGLEGGVVVANPIPAEHAIAHTQVEAWIAKALSEAAVQGIQGAASTPFLLARIAELSGGASLAANIELVLGNARLAARVAATMGSGL